MKRALERIAAGRWPRSASVGTITLAFDDRFRRRIRLATDQGVELLLDLERAERLDDGDGLKLEDGGIIEVRAAEEEVLEIACDTPQALARVAWHLGNRHLATEIQGSCLRIRPDHVIEDMARGLGAQVCIIRAPFRPEGGAYAKGASHPGQGHTHSHGNGHDHSH
jgi:urease accessory protein